MKRLSILVTATWSFLLPAELLAQTIRGHVLAPNRVPVSDAIVRITSTGGATVLEVIADSTGQFGAFVSKSGRFVVEVEALGYSPRADTIEVGLQEIVELELILSDTPIRLAPLKVVGRKRQDIRADPLRGFEERRYAGMKLGMGFFLTWEDARLKAASRISHVLGAAPGIRVVPHPELPGVSLIGARSATPQIRLMQRPPRKDDERELLAAATGGCAVLVYLDGVQIRDAYWNPIDNYVVPSEIHGIEVYSRSSELPTEFSGSDSRCGVIAIWTKRGHEH